VVSAFRRNSESRVPYRIDLDDPPEQAFDALVHLGALDVEAVAGGVAALMPDAVAPREVARVLGLHNLRVSPAVGRDDDSVWTLNPRSVRVRGFVIVPAGRDAVPGALRLVDGTAFGTGLHATTALCLEALEDLLAVVTPGRVLDVGTGSGIIALAALQRGIRHAVGLEIDRTALGEAAENARLNELSHRLLLVHGGPDALRGSWPLVFANIRAAELIELAPTLVRRIESGGTLVLSGIPDAVADQVAHTYRRLGMKPVDRTSRDGWTALMLRPSW
jgi:ribosomal protein L11 methyltransferase